MTSSTVPGQIDEERAKDNGPSGSTSWGHFAGMLVIMASTAGFWLLVFKLAKRGRKGG